MNELNINFDGCSIHDCYKGLNNINDSFSNINPLELYNADIIDVKVNTGFIPSKIIVLLGYYLDILNSKSKKITLRGEDDFITFMTKCGLIDFINNQNINYNLLNQSVVIPFCRVSDSDDLEYHFGELINRHNFEYNTVNLIMQLLGELHNNSKIHGRTNKIYIMGQHYPRTGKYDISIYDDGEGIQINDKGLIDSVFSSFITREYKAIIENKFGFDVLFIILCVTTRFSTKGPNIGGLGLYDLSEFLCNKQGYLNIASGKEFIKLNFNKVCDILDEESINIDNKKLNTEIKGTFISFTFGI